MNTHINIEPCAVAMARVVGIDRIELGNLITEYQMELGTEYLVGGYRIDAAIIGMHIALLAESLGSDYSRTHSEIVESVVTAINTLYHGE